MNWKPAVILAMALGAGCLTPQPTKYETVEERVEVLRAPAGTVKKKVALVNFRNLTDKSYLVQPATAQLVSLMIQSGYFDIIEPTLVESVISAQDQITTEKLQTLKDKFGADYFLTGSLTNFEVKENSSATCLLLGLLGSRSTKDYIVETAIDFRFVAVPSAQILQADVVENRRTDSSSSTGFLLSSAGTDVRVLQSSGGKLLRYALRDMVNRITKDM